MVGYSLSRLQSQCYYRMGIAGDSAAVWRGCHTTFAPAPDHGGGSRNAYSSAATFHYQLERNWVGRRDAGIVLISQEVPLGVTCLQQGISVVSCYFAPYNGT